MSVPTFLKPATRLALLASAAGFLFTASGAIAQESGSYDQAAYSNDSRETIEVIAPDIRAERTNGIPGKVSLSRPVPYDDLDLATRDGARELRARVRDTARQICSDLREAYPVHEQPLATKCYEGALKTAMVRADAAIRDARD